ncbi:DeoR family transcriptional regulator [Bradyrhizobium sp. USDA 4501]
MWQEERRRHIRSMLATFGTLSVDRLTEDFGVSLEPIRRDLMETKRAESSAGSAAESFRLPRTRRLPANCALPYVAARKERLPGQRQQWSRPVRRSISTREARQPPWPNA